MTDITGMQFTNWFVIEQDIEHPRRAWLCRCQCGKIRHIDRYQLLKGLTKSCGCAKGMLITNANTRHGKRRTAEYRIWTDIKTRCLNPKRHSYKNYGGRGIKLCERWMDFVNFLNDVGERPSEKHSLDRINNDGNYEPSNCRWVTKVVQANNTRANKFFTFQKATRTHAEWCKHQGINYKTFYTRMARGESIEQALRLTETIKAIREYLK